MFQSKSQVHLSLHAWDDQEAEKLASKRSQGKRTRHFHSERQIQLQRHATVFCARITVGARPPKELQLSQLAHPVALLTFHSSSRSLCFANPHSASTADPHKDCQDQEGLQATHHSFPTPTSRDRRHQCPKPKYPRRSPLVHHAGAKTKASHPLTDSRRHRSRGRASSPTHILSCLPSTARNFHDDTFLQPSQNHPWIGRGHRSPR